MNIKKSARGFTLVEVLIAVAVVGVVMTAIYSVFIQQTKGYSTQEQMVDLQRALRLGMSQLERDLRNAAYNPGGLTLQRATSDGVDNDCDGTTDEADDPATLFEMEAETIGLLKVSGASLSFSQDINGDGYTCEDREVTSYSLSGQTLKRNGKALIDNVEVLNFVYLAAAGEVAAKIEDIRSVQIAMIGRTKNEDASYTNTNSYANLQGTEMLPAQNDGYRRMLLTSQVYIRNLND